MRATGWRQFVSQGLAADRDALCEPYASVIDIDYAKLPAPEIVNAWSGEEYMSALRHDQSNPQFSFTVLDYLEALARQRGAPLDLIVAEAMILANSTWGGWLAELGVPGIYRSQASLMPGVKVRMGTRPAPHAGMGVAQYTWATSPLRRYVDLVNQWQIIACARHGRTAALAAPFKPKDAALFSIISGFDAAYTSYNDFQHGIERFWTLRWVAQYTLGVLDHVRVAYSGGEGVASSAAVQGSAAPPLTEASSVRRATRFLERSKRSTT